MHLVFKARQNKMYGCRIAMLATGIVGVWEAFLGDQNKDPSWEEIFVC